MNKGTTKVPFSISTASIIGAGIAGACMAHALCRRGLAVTVYERHSAPAAEASGNPLGLVMLRLDRGTHPAARFRKQAFTHAVALYESLGADGFVVRGVIDRLWDAPRREDLLAAQLFAPEDLYEQDGALYHRLAGAINPRRTIARLLDGCTVITGAAADPKTLDTDIVILANGRDMPLPLRYHAGQVDWMASHAATTPIMGDGYVAAHNGELVFGATFEPWSDPSAMPPVTDAASAQNIERLHGLLPDVTVGKTKARAALRVSAADRLPVAGYLHDNVYCLGALGPRGFTLAPLLADTLAAALLDETLPVDDDVLRLLEPQRLFHGRDVKDVG